MLRFLPLALLLASCGPDETISGYANGDATYRLTMLDGTPFAATATIQFPEEGRVSGNGSCNDFTAEQKVDYPWFELGPIASTRKACLDMTPESAYFSALAEMQIAEVAGDTLILSNEAGREMVFQAE